MLKSAQFVLVAVAMVLGAGTPRIAVAQQKSQPENASVVSAAKESSPAVDSIFHTLVTRQQLTEAAGSVTGTTSEIVRSNIPFSSVLIPSAQAPTALEAIAAGLLTTAEQQAIANCLSIMRLCVLPDGGIMMAYNGSKPTDQCWIQPYFACHTACGLLASGITTDRALVGTFLGWMATHGEAGGYWNDWSGTRGSYSNTGRCDAFDSSAAMYLLVLRKYQVAGGSVSTAMAAAARKAVQCLRNCTAPTGLTYAKPTYQIAYMMDNCESYAGLLSAAALFIALGDTATGNDCAARAAKMGTPLKAYWNPTKKLYAWARDSVGQYSIGLTGLYPDGLANLFACSFVGFQNDAWVSVVAAFQPEATYYTGAGVERFAMAAARVGGTTAATWRSSVTTTAKQFTSANVYAFRPALCVLVLTQGADWMPSIASTVKP